MGWGGEGGWRWWGLRGGRAFYRSRFYYEDMGEEVVVCIRLCCVVRRGGKGRRELELELEWEWDGEGIGVDICMGLGLVWGMKIDVDGRACIRFSICGLILSFQVRWGRGMGGFFFGTIYCHGISLD